MKIQWKKNIPNVACEEVQCFILMKPDEKDETAQISLND